MLINNHRYSREKTRGGIPRAAKGKPFYNDTLTCSSGAVIAPAITLGGRGILWGGNKNKLPHGVMGRNYSSPGYNRLVRAG